MIEEVIIAALWYMLAGYFSVASANKILDKRLGWWGQAFSLPESAEGAHCVITSSNPLNLIPTEWQISATSSFSQERAVSFREERCV